MIGMEDVGDVQCFCSLRRGFDSIQEIEKVGSFAEISPYRREILPLTGIVKIGRYHADLGSDGSCALAVLDWIDLTTRYFVLKTKHRDAGSDDIHGISILGS